MGVVILHPMATDQKPNVSLAAPTILALFRVHHGVASRAQLIARGVHRDAITRALAKGSLVAVLHGVYRSGSAPPTTDQEVMAACLAVDGAVASHRTAARLLGFQGFERATVEVSATTGARAEGVTVHRVKALALDDVMKIRGIPVTREARTLFDLADVLPERLVAAALDDAVRRKQVRLGLLARMLAERPPRRRGTRVMRALLRERAPEDARAVSELETRFLRLARRAGLPPGLINVDLHDERGGFIARPDVQYPDRRIAVFLDGHAFHSARPAFEKDRRQANALGARGWTVLRFTWGRVETEADEVVQELRMLLTGSPEAAPGAASGDPVVRNSSP